MTLLTMKSLKMWIFQNSKMVATAILKDRKIAEIIKIRDCGGHHFEQELMQQQLRWATVATIDMGRKEGAAVPLWRELGPRLVQRGLRRGLLPYQAASSSIQPFDHNRRGPKTGWGGCALFLGVAGSTSNTISRRPTSVPSGILVTIDVGRKLGGFAPFGVGS